jgi:hypothetical protein
MTADGRFTIAVGAPRLTLIRNADDAPQVITLPVQGPSGIPGGQGPKGDIGNQGDPGPRGERGATGDTTVKIVASANLQSSHTGNTNEFVLATVPVPARAMGLNGRLRIIALWSATNSANSKTVRIRFGGVSGTIYHEHALPNQAVSKSMTEIQNRNSASSQLGKPKTMDAFGDSTAALVTSVIDTDAAATDICFTGQLTSGGETVSLEAYIVELLLPLQQAEVGLYFAGDGIDISDVFEVTVDRATVPPVASPAFTGNPTAPTQTSGNNSTRLATTAFVQTLIAALSTVYTTYNPSAARTHLGLGGLSLLDLITWSQVDASLVATAAEYRSATDHKLIDPKIAFDAHAYVTLTDAASIAVDLATGFNFAVTITLNRELGFPTNPKVGQNGFIDVKQPGGGGKSLSYAAGYVFDGGVTPVVDAVANRVTSLYYHVRSLTEVRIGLAFRGVRASP